MTDIATSSGSTAVAEQGTIAGRFGTDRFGYAMPADGPYFQNPPYYYRNARGLKVIYETDPEAAANALPVGLDLPLPARVSLFIAHYPSTTFGPYHEAILGIRCQWQGETALYLPQLATTTVFPTAAGREIWGFNKKIAHIDLFEEGEMLVGIIERPKGTRLVTASMRRERPTRRVPGFASDISLRIIPSPEEGEPSSAVELVMTRSRDGVGHEAWEGPGTLTFDTHSELDPWFRFPVERMLGAYYGRGDSTLPGGRIIKSY